MASGCGQRISRLWRRKERKKVSRTLVTASTANRKAPSISIVSPIVISISISVLVSSSFAHTQTRFSSFPRSTDREDLLEIEVCALLLPINGQFNLLTRPTGPYTSIHSWSVFFPEKYRAGPNRFEAAPRYAILSPIYAFFSLFAIFQTDPSFNKVAPSKWIL